MVKMWSFQFRDEEQSGARIVCPRGSFQELPPPTPGPGAIPPGSGLLEEAHRVSGQRLGQATPLHTGALPSTSSLPGWNAVCGRPSVGAHTWNACGSGAPVLSGSLPFLVAQRC